jgi:WD40 repeat protein
MNKVFVSYSRRNKTFAERIARDLNDAGLEVWVDFRQIHAGELWQEEIYRGIERSDIVVVCLSPDAVVSEWVQREVNAAHEQGKFIIPVMAVDSLQLLQETESMSWLLDVHFINFVDNYENAFPELLDALPGKRSVTSYDVVDVENIPNPFKGLEAFQQTDSHFFFGRENLISKSLKRLRQDRPTRFLAVIGASGSGKSSLVRAGVLPSLRKGTLPGSEQWRLAIFTPDIDPVHSLAQRLAPMIEGQESDDINALLHKSPENLDLLVGQLFEGATPEARLLLIVDQFEEIFTRAGESDRKVFLDILNHTVTVPDGKVTVLITMRADFFDRLSHYPALAELFEQENMVIVTEMTAPELLRTIEGPAKAVGLTYDRGLSQNILEEVMRQPGSLPLLQYALKELFEHRDGARLTTEAYREIGGVKRALARHAEKIYSSMGAAQQAIMRRVLLRLVEVGESGKTTRRKIDRTDLTFRDVPDEAVQELLDLMTSAQSRLLITSRHISSSGNGQTTPKVWIEVGHEALIREWERFTGWVAENKETLRYGSELMISAHDWETSNRDNAYLLTGNRLVRAEIWLDEADATVLQREFVHDSMVEGDRQSKLRQEQMERELHLQRSAANRLRGFVGLLAVALIVAVVLSIWALDSQSKALESQNRAEDALNGEQRALETAVANENQALSLALAASANRAFSDNDLELAVLLSVSANGIDDPPPQSQQTLAEIAYEPGTRFLFEGDGDEIAAVALSHDSSRTLLADGNKLTLWNSISGEKIMEFGTNNASASGQYEPIEHTETINSVIFSANGSMAASAGDDSLVILWDVETGTAIRQFIGHSGSVKSVVFSPYGSQLASAGADQIIILWNVESGEEIARFEGHEDTINSIAFSSDGQHLLSGSDDNTAKLWDMSGNVIKTFADHTGNVTDVEFDPSNPLSAITSSGDDSVRRWNIETGENTDTYERHEGDVNAIDFSPDGESFVSVSNDETLIWWTSNGQVIDVFGEHTDEIIDIAFSANGTYLVSASADGTARLWDLRNVEELQRYEGHDREDIFTRIVVGVYGPDESTMLSGSYDGTLRLWDTNSGLTIQQFLGHSDEVRDVAFSEDGLTALSASKDESVILWDVESGEARSVLVGHYSPVNTVVYLPDGERAVSGAEDGGLILWDLESGEIIRRYGPLVNKGDIGHAGPVYDIAIHPEGHRMLSASADGNLILWDIEDGSIVTEYKGHNDEIWSVAYAPSGETAVSGSLNGSIILWDVRDDTEFFGGIIRRIDAHDRTVYSLDFAPDGQSFISASKDRTLRLWDIETGFEIRRYNSLKTFRSADFNHDGTAVLTGMNDATLREWRILISPNDLIRWTFANRFVPNPTCPEREQYRLLPLCEDGHPAPTRTPFPLPSPTPIVEVNVLTIGETATINTDDGDPLNLRAEHNIGDNIIASLADGEVVTLLEGPVKNGDLSWWKVRITSGEEGWVVESVPEEYLQTLVP